MLRLESDGAEACLSKDGERAEHLRRHGGLGAAAFLGDILDQLVRVALTTRVEKPALCALGMSGHR